MVLYLGQAAELARWSELLGSPRHPYTRTLLDSVPLVHGDIIRTAPGGEIPDPRRPPSGCRFHTRCPVGPLADPGRTRCLSEDPHDVPANGNGREAACHFPLDESVPS
jgi:peptide/nickel transport system ATP-binding protein